jgi:Mrp family chromosome partitioning ATPase
VTTVAARLAATAALTADAQVLLVDANLSRPAVAQRLGLQGSRGVADVLRGTEEIANVIHAAGAPGLFAMTAGAKRTDDGLGEMATSLPRLVVEVGRRFDLVVFDLPAAGEASFALRLAGLLDGVLLVIEAERVRGEVAQRVQEALRRSQSAVLGAVLNKRRRYVPEWLYRTL